MIDLNEFGKALHSKDLSKFLSFFDPDALILGYSPEGYFNFLTRNLAYDIYREVDISTNLIPIRQNYIVQVFFNQILILEEDLEINPNTGLIKGTNYTTDCFGKLTIFNDSIGRLLTIRPKRGVNLKTIRFIDESLEEELFINKGNLFDDGYFTGYFKIIEDDFKTKISKIKIITDSGIENQHVVLRGLDYPFFSINRPIIDGNKVILTEDVNKIYKIVVTFVDDSEKEIEFLHLTSKEITFDKEVRKVYQSINGCAMNYFIEA